MTVEKLTSLKTLDFYSPAVFYIEVKGKVDKSLSESLGAMKISHHMRGDKTIVSRLEGEILDQAALFGIMNTLYEMRFPVIIIKAI